MSYLWEQTVFSLCMAANAVADIQAQPTEQDNGEADLSAYMDIALNGGNLKEASTKGAFKEYEGDDWPGFFATEKDNLPGRDWTIAWGPCVYVANPKTDDNAFSGYATNSMYVAYSPSNNAYVVAIAGTNPKNVYDWTQEDFEVSARLTVQWGEGSSPPIPLPYEKQEHDPYDSAIPQISAATAFGISNLLTKMQSPDNGSGLNLKEFLDGIDPATKANSKLVFTGHSLGGALAPSLAYFLYPDAQSEWDQIEIYPFAGATPGNAAWVNIFAKTYGQVLDCVNIHDVVPRGWNQMRTVVSDKRSGKYGEYYDSIFGPLNTGTFDTGVGPVIARMLNSFINKPDGVDYENIPHITFGAPTFEDNWGTYLWDKSKDKQGYTLKTNPTWSKWPVPTRSQPITPTNPQYDSTLPTALGQIGNLIGATHISQYHSGLDVLPVQLLPEVPAEYRLSWDAIVEWIKKHILNE